MPKSSDVSTNPVPKNISHHLLTATREVRGWFGLVSQFASSSLVGTVVGNSAKIPGTPGSTTSPS